MCRQLAYVGPDRFVHDIVLAPPHSLEHQAYAARELLSGVVSADGFGAAWYQDDVGDTPAVYRSTLPIWADESFRSVAGHVKAHTVLANVRNATEAGTTEQANVHPFADGRFALVHNGFLEDFRGRWMRDLRATLNDAHYAALRGTTESETIFRMIRTRMDDDDRGLRDATLDVVREVLEIGRAKDLQAQLDILLTEGTYLVSVRASASGPSNSAYVYTAGARGEAEPWPEASLVASEPLDGAPGWTPQDHDTLLVLHAGEEPVVHRV